jgi:hypothetical protein
MTKDRPAAGGSASTKADAGVKSGGSATSAKGDASVKADTKSGNASTSAKADAGTKGDGKSPDAMVTAKVKTGFIKDKIVRSRNYNVDTKDGVVTLKGKARSQAELDRALEIAKQTEGVKDVKNEVQVMASADTSGSAKAGSSATGASGGSKAGASASGASAPKADTKTGASASSKGTATAK